MSDTCWLDISLEAFTANIRHAQANLAAGAQLMVAVKSDAYGHGGDTLARAAIDAGADALAVLDIATGVGLRAHLPETPMLAWLLAPGNDFRAASAAKLTLGISHLWQLEKLATEAHDLTTTVHLKIDTGLHRNGALASVWPALVARAAELEKAGVLVVEGIWSHLADTSVEEDRKSLERFLEAVAIARGAGLSPSLIHIAASAAATDFPESRLDLVRIGISIYGVSPFDDRSAQDMGFAPVMAVRASVVECNLAEGTALLGMGYAHGLLSLAPGSGWVAWGGHKLEVISVEASHTLLSIPQGVTIAQGDVLTLWGDPEGGSPSAEDWAGWAGTIGDEVVSALGPSLRRHYLAG